MKKMYDKDSGSIGIGSLIIFIALMVVAAIAAAVIVGTVSSMRDKAYGAANSAEHVVNGNIWGAQYVGIRASTSGPILYINISFSVVSDSIDLNNTIIEYSSNNTAPTDYRLNPANPYVPENTGDNYYFGVDVKDFNGGTWGTNGKYWVHPGQLVIITIELPQPMGQGQHATLIIVPDPGAPYTHNIVAPANFGTALAIEL